MRIQNNNGNTNIAFGYNKALNKRLKTLLIKSSSPFAYSLLDLNRYCNVTEDAIDANFRKGRSFAELEALIGLFVRAKKSLIDVVEEHFPSLRYAERESLSYLTEDTSRAKLWKYDVGQEIVDEFPERVFDDAEIEKALREEQPISPPLAPLTNNLEPPKNTIVACSVAGKSNDIIRESLPNSESPQGFSSIGGMDDLKRILHDSIVLPIKDPEMARLDEIEYGKKMPRATLLYGPPGCGKTFFAEAIAREADVPFFKLKISELGSEYINKTSKNYEVAFEAVETKVREIGKPCILFIDELDGLSKHRGGSDSTEDLKQLGTLLDLINNARSRGIVIIAATNKHKLVDEAVRNRFDNQVFVPMPNQSTVIEVLRKKLQHVSKAAWLLASENDLSDIAQKAEGFSTRTITDFISKVATIARADSRRDITKGDFLKVIEESQALKIQEGVEGYKATTNKRRIGFIQEA